MKPCSGIRLMAHELHARRFFAAWSLLAVLLLPTCAGARARGERREHQQQENGRMSLMVTSLVPPPSLPSHPPPPPPLPSSSTSSLPLSLLSHPLGMIPSWASFFRDTFVGPAAILMQTVVGHEESDEPLLRIPLMPTPSRGQNHLVAPSAGVPVPSTLAMILTALIWGSCALGAAFYYRRNPEVVELKACEGRPEQLSRFSSDPFDVNACLNEPGVCVWSCCCPCVVWADTVDRLDLIRYWIAFAIFASLWILQHTFALFFLWWAIAILLAWNRHRIRRAFGMQVQWLVATFTSDCMCFCMGCLTCLIAQEARHVKRAAVLGHGAVVDKGGVSSV
eukprot:TRINITY_DN2982_c0_g1_i1.p1 TRINITY_DN2982_c0_g1~~TRINITY_DN2982_c0_g1_i1.p1  ORF type:complete len:336 (+),score=33.64 TRINITY_DN2982_c0_g1_i1:39-1046(+)